MAAGGFPANTHTRHPSPCPHLYLFPNYAQPEPRFSPTYSLQRFHAMPRPLTLPLSFAHFLVFI